jgi:ABC-2 type transport system ATP-binding protein
MAGHVAVKVKGIYKDFKLPHEKTDSLKSAFTSFYKKKDKSFDVQHALKDISFEIKKGEFFGIVGRNGSGKSTLLKIIAGIYQPTEGKIIVNGKLVPFIELGVGFNPELTGRENVYLNGALLGFSRKKIDEMYDDIVDFAELHDFMEQKLKNYSSGMQVRLAFSVATRAEADILLVDEVLAVGDADFQRKCFDYFRDLKKKEKTVIFVSHDMGSVREYCDRAVLIDRSELIYSGSSGAVADEYIKLFVDSDSAKNGGTQSDDEDKNHLGNNKISIMSVEAGADKKTNRVNIEVRGVVNEDVLSTNIGFKLKDPVDKALLGTNTTLQKIAINGLKTGETFTTSFSFDNLLNYGKYSVDVAIESSDGEVYSWWLDAVKLDIKKEKLTGFPIEPEISTRFKLDKKA